MEIKYKRTYTPGFGKRYTMGEIPAMLGYAMEIADPRVRMKEGRLVPGQVCMLLFGLTPQEYALKDENSKALDVLAEKLAKRVPADRLMGWRIMDLKGAAVKSDLQPQTGESIDDGEFARRLREKAPAVQPGPIDVQLMEVRRLQQLCAGKGAPDGVKQDWQAARKALGKALMGLEKAYVAYDASTGGRWPAVGFDGRIEIFTLPERAERVQKQLSAAQADLEIWSIHQLTAAELEKLLCGCAGDGLDALRVDNGFAAAELNIRDCIECAPAANAPLRGMMIREVQYGMRWNRLKEAKAEEPRLRGALESMLTLRNFVWREAGNAALYAVCAGGQREKCVVLSGQNGSEKLLAAFTDPQRAKTFAAQLKDKAGPVEMRFDELAQRSAACDGILIDVGSIGYRLMKADYDKVRDLRGKPPVVVRVQPPENRANVQLRGEDMGSLPNPDDYAPAPKPEAPAREAPRPEKQTEPEARKGFFKKLFGKQGQH